WAAMRSLTSSNQNGGTMWWWTSMSFGLSCASTAGGGSGGPAADAAAPAVKLRPDGAHAQPVPWLWRPKGHPAAVVRQLLPRMPRVGFDHLPAAAGRNFSV